MLGHTRIIGSHASVYLVRPGDSEITRILKSISGIANASQFFPSELQAASFIHDKDRLLKGHMYEKKMGNKFLQFL